MNEKVLDHLYNYALYDGFEGGEGDFAEVLINDESTFNKMFEYAKKTGYKGDANSFINLIHRQDGQKLSSGLIKMDGVSVRDIGGDDGKLKVKPKYQENTDKALLDIYNSPGFRKKRGIEEELSKNVKDESLRDYYIGDRYTTDEIIKEKTERLLSTPVTEVKEVSSRGGDEYEGGFMRRKFKNSLEQKDWGSREEYQKDYNEFISKENPIETSIYINEANMKKAPLKTSDVPDEDLTSDMVAITAEEKEHSTHVPLVNPAGETNFLSNITPGAAEVVAENILIKDDYLDDPTEAIAKKRVTEVYLIGKGSLSPGEDLTEGHFKEILNSDTVPPNITQLIMGVSGIGYDENDKDVNATFKRVKEKLLSDPELYNESLGRFLNIMNKIAFIDKKDGIFTV